MNRRRALALLLCAAVPPAAAQEATLAEGVAAELRAQGYEDVTVRRTLLGRTRVTGRLDGWRREVVLSESRGAVLRDVERPLRRGGSDRPRRRTLWRDRIRERGR